MQIRKAKREKSRIRLGLIGPSGSGKTLSALLIAYGLAGDWEKIGVIDTENRSADLYAGAKKGTYEIGEFLKIDLTPPYTPDKYVQAIKAFENAGVNVIIVDSLSHAWTGEGGVLDIHSQAAAKAGNSFAAWREVTPKHNRLVETMLSSSAHVIATLRAKAEYVIDQDEKGRKAVRKVGLAPIQRDGIEYEFDIVLDLSQDHSASVSKDRTGIFDGEYFIPSPDTGRRIAVWLSDAKTGPDKTDPAPEATPESEPVPPSAPTLVQEAPPRSGEDGNSLAEYTLVRRDEGMSAKGTPYVKLFLSDGNGEVLIAYAKDDFLAWAKELAENARVRVGIKKIGSGSAYEIIAVGDTVATA